MKQEIGVYLSRVDLMNVRCFGAKATLFLEDDEHNWKQWTVILGDNGTGKTSLLQAIAGLEQRIFSPRSKDSKLPDYVSKLFLSEKYKTLFKSENIEGHVKGFLNFESEGKQAQVSFGFKGSRGAISSSGNNGDGFEKLKIYGYGANRMMSSASLSESQRENSESLFNEEADLVNAEEWLLQLDYAASKDSKVKDYAIEKRDLVKKSLIELLPEITDIRFTDPTKENLKSSVEFLSPFGWTLIQNLSFGYKTMVAWMIDMASRLFERYPSSSNPLEEPAIVLIDEIDLHLHPKWQKEIFNYLSLRFPKTQFIVTAHSPLIVQSAPENVNLVLLVKKDKQIIIDQEIENVRQWRIDQILTSDLFGMESSRNLEIQKWLEERKKLLQKKELTSKERERLDYLNSKAHNLPTADNPSDIEAMDIIRSAADYLKRQKK